MSLSAEVKRTALIKKIEKVHEGFAEMVDGLDVKELEANLLMYSKYKEEILVALEESEAIEEAKKVLSDLKGPFNDKLKALKLKTAYIHILLTEKGAGGALDAEEIEEE